MIGKKRKVLKLIERAPAELGFVVDSKDYDAYIKTYDAICECYKAEPIVPVYTKEEFDLLKGYFSNK